MVVMAGPRSFQQAKAIAEKQAALLGVTIDQKAMTKARKQGSKGEITLSQESYYVFPNANSKGFTIVSGDDRLPEIVGYSSQGYTTRTISQRDSSVSWKPIRIFTTR